MFSEGGNTVNTFVRPQGYTKRVLVRNCECKQNVYMKTPQGAFIIYRWYQRIESRWENMKSKQICSVWHKHVRSSWKFRCYLCLTPLLQCLETEFGGNWGNQLAFPVSSFEISLHRQQHMHTSQTTQKFIMSDLCSSSWPFPSGVWTLLNFNNYDRIISCTSEEQMY